MLKQHVYFVVALSLFLLLLAPASLQADDDQWTAKYWNNTELKGDPVLERKESKINYDWERDAPNSAVNRDEFSVRWERDVDFDEGTYQFTATMDDGMRVWVDDNKIINSWINGRDRTITANVYLTKGEHEIKVEYYEDQGTARAEFDWERVYVEAAPISNWRGEYFNNDSLSGSPVLVRDDAAVDFDWGTDAPAGNVNGDFFSVRWSRSLNFGAGTHYFTVTADDGVRLWVNGQLLIDQWQPQAATTYTGQITFAGATMANVVMEYFEQAGLAVARLGVSQTAVSTLSPATPQLPTLEGQTAVMTEARHLNVRSGPGLDFEPITALSQGDVVELLGRDAFTVWIKVRLANGVTGWVSGRFLTSSIPLNQLPIMTN